MHQNHIWGMAERLIEKGLNGPSQREEIVAALQECWIDKIADIWDIHDVQQQADEMSIELTDDESREVLQRVLHDHDATIGINWDTIDMAIILFRQDGRAKPAGA